MLGSRGMVVLGAVVLAGLAFFVLIRGGGGGGGVVGVKGSDPVRRIPVANSPGPDTRGGALRNGPALDDIDAESRQKMRELLREAGEE
jgi:hypothetical protein